MALYAIADTHLSLGGTNKSMTVFSGWDDYVERLEEHWRNLVTEDDTVVIAGDISWGMNLKQAKDDFAFLHSLPGRKLIFNQKSMELQTPCFSLFHHEKSRK